MQVGKSGKSRLASKGEQQSNSEDTSTQPASREKKSSPLSRVLKLTAHTVSQEFWFQPFLPFTRRLLEIILPHIIKISRNPKVTAFKMEPPVPSRKADMPLVIETATYLKMSYLKAVACGTLPNSLHLKRP